MTTTTEVFNVRWNEKHMSSTLLGGMAQMLDQKILVDVTLSCEAIKVQCHRLVLASCSPFFADILARNSSPDLVICLVGIKSWQILAIISFMYRGVIECITSNQLEELMEVAKFLRIYGFYNYHVTSKTESRSEDDLSTLSGNSSCKDVAAATCIVMQKKRKQSQMTTSEPIIIDLVDGDSSASGRSDTEVDHGIGISERNDIVGVSDDQEGLPSRLPMAKPFKKRPVVINKGKGGTVDRSQFSRNEEVAPDVGVEGAVRRTTTQNENDFGNSTKKIKIDRKGSCDSSNGSLLDLNLLSGVQSEEGAESAREEDTARTTQLHIEAKVKEFRRNTRRGRKSRIISSTPSQPDIAVYPEKTTAHLTVARTEEVHSENYHQQSVLQGISVPSTQAPALALDIAEFERLWANRLMYATYLVVFGCSIEQASLSTGIPVPYLTEYLRLRRQECTMPYHAHQSQQKIEQEDSSNPTADHDQSPTYAERELQSNAKQIHDQMLLACLNMTILQGQSSSNPKVPKKK